MYMNIIQLHEKYSIITIIEYMIHTSHFYYILNIATNIELKIRAHFSISNYMHTTNY